MAMTSTERKILYVCRYIDINNYNDRIELNSIRHKCILH